LQLAVVQIRIAIALRELMTTPRSEMSVAFALHRLAEHLEAAVSGCFLINRSGSR
jgi:hypothetical protein